MNFIPIDTLLHWLRRSGFFPKIFNTNQLGIAVMWWFLGFFCYFIGFQKKTTVNYLMAVKVVDVLLVGNPCGRRF